MISTIIGPFDGGDWRSEAWEELRAEIRDERKGLFNDKGLFGEIDSLIKKKIEATPVFAENVKGRPSDEIYLLSPRNTAVRGSLWDGTFRWNWAVGGSNYVFHLYKDGAEIVETPRNGKRTINLKDSVEFIPGALYTWDVTCCVNICNLPLSSNAFDRPEFFIITTDEERAVEREIIAVARLSASRGTGGSPVDIALRGLVLERHRLYMEEVKLLSDGIKKHPKSALLHLVLSSVSDLTACPLKAREEYERARELSTK
ncbi:MAG: hypothetical protein JW984_15615 [Deltaproteobacteria bacterium]|uniref:Uncharacterized protein n=1 Tax=Candidatus Zymogenus saltonus TaxID=2844893 RepID=A0A9D8PS91_9DELT|nr:hypothetical protein [Candidatus Zymogenus saltonus]